MTDTQQYAKPDAEIGGIAQSRNTPLLSTHIEQRKFTHQAQNTQEQQ